MHAALVASTIRYLERQRFRCEAEVSYSRYGERGSIDVLGLDAERSAVVVGEAKSEIASLEETLRTHDVKVRLAPAICFERWGSRPRHVARLLILPDSMTARRGVERSAVVLRTSLPGRATDLRAWLRRPSGEFAGVLFLPLAPVAGARESPRAVSRVRRAGARAGELR